MLSLLEYIELGYISKKQLDLIEKYLDGLFAQLGIDVEFSKHFLDRLNDARNGKQIIAQELVSLFNKEFQKYGKIIAQLGPDKEAVLTDLSSNINAPVALEWNSKTKKLEMIAKTVMRKKNFYSKAGSRQFKVR